MTVTGLILIALICAAVVWFALPQVTARLRTAGMVDTPNARSSHSVATPRGGGIIIILVVTLVWFAANLATGSDIFGWLVFGGFVLLAVLSFRDDIQPMHVTPRLLAQFTAVAIPVFLLPYDMRILPNAVPLIIDRAVMVFAWLWFVNLYNFMDGIDGIAATQTATVGAGAAVALVVSGAAATTGAAPYVAVALIGATLGFLRFNWPPAKVFLGDVGAIPIGYALGWILLMLAVNGMPLTALILPLYFLADATMTLLKRAAAAKPLGQAHREHLYQRAASGSGTHRPVTLLIALANIAFAITGVLTLLFPVISLVVSLIILGLTMRALMART